MKIALLQINPTIGDIEGNARRILESVTRAGRQGADLCVTSELALLGYPPRDLLLYPGLVERSWEALGALAGELRALPPTLVGIAEPNPVPEGRPLFNSAVLLRKGAIENRFRKSLLPTYDVFDEDRYFEPASPSPCLSLDQWTLGVTICEDIWNDRDFWHRRRYHLDPVEQLTKAGARAVINLSASPFGIGKQRLRESMLGSMAKKHGVFIFYVNQVGGNDDLVFDGRSCAFDPSGELIAKAGAFAEDVLVVDLASAKGLLSGDLPSEEAEIWQALVLGTRDYVRKCGFRQVLLGLSGGIDSALTAAIAAEAIGRENVIGVMMPSPYSSRGSIDDSAALASRLGIRTVTLSISDLMQAFERTLAPAFSGLAPDVTEENIQARIRGGLLMAMSNKYGALLLTTGNKSELSVGYCTLYGDMSGGLAVISDLPKMTVYRLARWLNRNRDRSLIPESSISKPPSAELRPDQTDQDSLPPYEILDEILRRHIEEHQSAAQLRAQGYDPKLVERVLGLVDKAEFKRKQAAPGLKITDRAFGSGWRMPIAKRRWELQTEKFGKEIAPMDNELKRVSFIGLGKLGLPIASCFAKKGFPTIGVDVDPRRVDAVNKGVAPIHEPGLQQMMDEARGRLSATHDVEKAILESDVTFVIVPTPSTPKGGFSLEYALEAGKKIGAALKKKTSYHLVVLTSTVMPGATDGEFKPVLESASGKKCGQDFGLCYSPEFIALGSVIHDFLNTDFLLIGESDEKAGRLLAQLYHLVGNRQPPVARMNFVNAELAKISVNTFVTTRIAFANMLCRICEGLPGANVDTVTSALGLDSRIGRKYLKGAIGYGGPCFPRDNIALSVLARSVGASAAVAEATDKFNRQGVEWLAEKVKRVLPQGGTVAVMGLAYKPETDVVEESQGTLLAQCLAKEKVRVIAFDPIAMQNAKKALPENVTFAKTAAECLSQADVAVITIPCKEFSSLQLEEFARPSSPRYLIDCWRLFEKAEGLEGFHYLPLGVGGLSAESPVRMKRAA